jgi:hypothetical protein
VHSTWQPTTSSRACNSLEEALEKLAKSPKDKRLKREVEFRRQFVSGTRYGSIWEHDLPDVYRVRSGKTDHYYVGHYNSELYAEQKKEYEEGQRKSKPSGRTWCYIDDATARWLKDKFFID